MDKSWFRFRDHTPDISQLPPPSSDEPPSSDLPVTSLPPADAGEVYTALSADVVEGDAPLTVNFTGRLVGGPNNNQDYYCVESAFEFGDGMVQSAIPGCLEWTPEAEIQRAYSASYVYDQPGIFAVVFSLGGTQSESLTIVVHDQTRARGDDEPRPLGIDDRPEGDSQVEGKGPVSSGCLGPLGLVLLPLMGNTRQPTAMMTVRSSSDIRSLIACKNTLHKTTQPPKKPFGVL